MKLPLRILALPLSIAWLHTVSTWPMRGGLSAFAKEALKVAPDLLLLVGVAVIGGAARYPRATAWLCSLGLLAGLLVRALFAAAENGFQRAFELDDLRYTAVLTGQWWGAMSVADRWQLIPLYVLCLGVLVALTYLSFRAVTTIARRDVVSVSALVLLPLTAVVGFVSVSADPQLGRFWQRSDLLAFADKTVVAIDRWLDPAYLQRRVDRGLARMADVPSDLRGLQGVDVHLLVIESYGRVAWRDEQIRPAVADIWRELAPRLSAAGYGVRSLAVTPTISGGGSWLAHAELLTSVKVPDQPTCDRVLGSAVVPLTNRFGDAGYRVIEVMQAMNVHWPEGAAFYGIDEHITSLEFDYHGFAYPFSRVPDQFALHHTLERFVKPATEPLFVSFISATSHAPWSQLPPYIDDWQIGPKTFDTGPAKDFGLTFHDLASPDRLLPGYLASLDYALRAAVGYVERLPRPSLVILIGDHQPLFSRILPQPDYSFDVPMHVLSNRPELLAPFAELGFREGCEIDEGVVAMPLCDFAPTFLRAFSK